MIMKISRREGFGSTLAGSMPDAVERLGAGAEEYGFHTKGQSFTYNCTQAVAMSLASSVATRGADHLKGHPFAAMIGLQDMLERISVRTSRRGSSSMETRSARAGWCGGARIIKCSWTVSASALFPW